MKVLITGASGMVGKNLVEYLEAKKTFDILKPNSKELDLCNKSAVFSYLNEHKPELVVHCAGKVGGIQANIKNPVSFLIDNLEMGKNVVLAGHEAGVKKLINLGSSCMYPKDYKNPLKEEYLLAEKLEPTNEGYALAKIAVAKLCEFINQENEECSYKTLIPCNLYGYYDKFDPKVSHMIPAVIRKIHEAKTNNEPTVEIWGNGKARREFMFSRDLAEFIYFSIENLEDLPDYINVGLGYDYSILEYYQAIAEVIGFSGDFTFDTSKPVGMKQKVVDVAQLNKTGWSAPTNLTEGIRLTYKYFLANEVTNE